MKEPIVSKAGQDIKSELEKSVNTLRELRDEVRVKLHLAGMDVKDEWNRLEPQLESTLERAARDITDASKTALTDVTEAVRKLRSKLR
jgi:hypothetical protein